MWGESVLLRPAPRSCEVTVDVMALSPVLLFMDRFVAAFLPFLLVELETELETGSFPCV